MQDNAELRKQARLYFAGNGDGGRLALFVFRHELAPVDDRDSASPLYHCWLDCTG